jgi:hypothetical protein
MRNLLVLTLLAGFSLGAAADHHGGDHDGKAGHHKGMFKHADQDGDGAVSTEEHEQALEKMADKRRERFSKMDSDGNGSLTEEEARAAKTERHERMKEKHQQKHN